MKTHRHRPGFTLVELLVVIAIVATLAAVVLTLTRGAKDSAKLIQRASTLKSCGLALMSNANDNNGRLEYWAAGTGGFKYSHYSIVGDILGWTDGICEPMHWDIKLLPPAPKGNGSRWNCAAINFSSLPEFGVNWENSLVSDASQYVRRLNLSSVGRPNAYAFLLDASNSTGAETFRVNVGTTDLPALRTKQSTNAFFLDGSCRILNRADLKNAGFNEAYDNSTKPPKRVKL